MFALRDYQQAATDKVFEKHRAGARSLLLIAATGAGKTVMFGDIARRWQGRVLILAHREELIEQAVQKVGLITGEHPAIEQGKSRAAPMDRIVCGMIQTMCREERVLAGPPPSLIITDEAHHAAAGTYLKAIGKIPHGLHLGVTATPWREDKKDLADVFEDVAFEIGLIELIRRGYLCDVQVEKLGIEIDIRGAKVSAGEYSANDIGRAVDPFLEAIAAQVARQYKDKKIIAFCPLVETSKALVAALNAHGMRAMHVDGDKSTDRDGAISWFASAKTGLLSNAQLLTEGYDEPGIDCVIMLSPTKSRTSYSQKMGRGTRPLFAPGFDLETAEGRLAAIAASSKGKLLVIDPHFRSRHAVVGPQDIVSETEEEARLIGRYLAHGDSLLAAYDQAKTAAKAKIEKLAQDGGKRQQAQGDGEQNHGLAFLAWTLGEAGIAAYEPVMRWHSLPVTPNQRSMLEHNGINMDWIANRGAASAVIDVIFRRRRQNLATYRQAAFLARMKIMNPGEVTFGHARELIDQLKRAR